ncbi:MAG: hypothetical protein WA709_15690 [Stellaceae bacterium]
MNQSELIEQVVQATELTSYALYLYSCELGTGRCWPGFGGFLRDPVLPDKG